MRKTLSMLLILALLIGLTGTFSVALADEQEVLEMSLIAYSSSGYTPTTDNFFTDKLLEFYNIKMNVLPVDGWSDEQWTTFWASGEMADVIINPTSYDTRIQPLILQGFMRSYDYEWFKELAPDLYQAGVEMMGEDLLKTQMTVKGEVYPIPRLNYTGVLNDIYGIRNDWLEAVGITELPTTLDEFEAMIAAFTNDDPDGNGQNDTYGISSITYGASNIPALFDVCYNYAFWVDDEGKVELVNTKEGYREFLRKMNEWYVAGYIDPEFVTDERGDTRNKWSQGQYGLLSDNAWWFDIERGEIGLREILYMNDEGAREAGLSMMAGLRDDDGVMWVNQSYWDVKSQASGWFGADATDEMVKRILPIYNDLLPGVNVERAQILLVGEEGVNWDYDDKEKGTVINHPKTNEEGQALGAYGMPGSSIWRPEMLEGTYREDMIFDYELAMAGIYHDAKVLYTGTNFSGVTLTDSALDKNTAIKALVETYRLQAISGEKNLDSDWDAFVAQVQNYGVADVIAEYEAGLSGN